MAPYDTPTSYNRDQWYVIRTTCTAATSTVNVVDGWYYTATTANYASFADPLPKCETDSQIQLARMASFGINPLRVVSVRKPTCGGRARAFRHLPRGKLRYWRSLKEKRQAWGFA